MIKKITFIHILGAWWSFAVLLATLQLWGMTRLWWTIPLGLVASALCFYGHHCLARYRKTKTGRVIIVLYALGNCIPLVLQLLGLKEPGIDNLLAAGIGLGFFTCSTSD